MRSARERLGCWLHERWRTELVLAGIGGDQGWLGLCNRSERLKAAAAGPGLECDWPDSSTLTVARVFPGAGQRLLRHVLSRWPITIADVANAQPPVAPKVSIVIPVGGKDRLAQFELALAAARGQRDVACEVVVVEQSSQAELAGRLPADVRHVHQFKADSVPFNKSWALNRGVRDAAGESIVLLDGDYLMPARFAAECHAALQAVEAVRPARLIFHLDQASTSALHRSRDLDTTLAVEKIVANNPTPVAVRRSTYWEVGGHDEGYFGWGGEDTEFLDRLRTREVSEAGWMPLVHAWHAPAAKKADGDRNRAFHDSLMRVPSGQRVARLRGSASGSDQPLHPWRAAS